MMILIATVLDQFCAKIIACCLYPYTKCSCRGMKKISSIFRRSVLTMIFFNEFSRHLNKKHLVQRFPRFNPCVSSLSLATDDEETVSTPKYSLPKLDHYFWNTIEKDRKQHDVAASTQDDCEKDISFNYIVQNTSIEHDSLRQRILIVWGLSHTVTAVN